MMDDPWVNGGFGIVSFGWLLLGLGWVDLSIDYLR